MILFASVGHAGQINPVLAIAEEVAHSYPQYELHFMTHSFYEKRVLKQIPNCKFISLGHWDFPTNIKKPEYFQQWIGNPLNVSCAKFVLKLLTNTEQFKQEHLLVEEYLTKVTPILSVVDSLSNAVWDTLLGNL